MMVPDKTTMIRPPSSSSEVTSTSTNAVVTLIEEETPIGKQCSGSCAVHDVQLSQLRPDVHFKPLAEPTVVFEFNFEDAQSIIYDEAAIARLEIQRGGRVDGVFAWWDIDMDGSGGDNTLTMAPEWKDVDSRWRDHWMQAIYHLPQRAMVNEGEVLPLICGHDEFSLWFAIGDGSTPSSIDRPYCTCDFHSRFSRTMIYRLNDVMSDESLRLAIDKSVSLHPSHVVAIGEGSLIGLLAASRADRVTVVEPTAWMRTIIFRYIRHYNLSNVRVVGSIEEIPGKPSLILGEPSLLSAVLPWENLPFWYETKRIREEFGDETIPCLPQECSIRALPMRFDHLHKTAGRVGTVNGFDLSAFDDLSEKARSAVDAIVEDYSLWEYGGVETEGLEGIAEGEVGIELLRLNLLTPPHREHNVATLTVGGEMNGVALFTNLRFGDYWFSTGRRREDSVDWHPGHKQGVYFIPPNQDGAKKLYVKTEFENATGGTHFFFSLNPIDL